MSQRKFVWLAYGVLALAYFPFLVTSQYVYPLGIHEWDWISGSYWGATPLTWWERQVYWYQHIGGRYTSAAFFGTVSGWYSLASFRTVLLLLLLLIPFGLLYTLGRLLRGGLGLLCGIAIWLLFLHQLTNIYDSLLRFTCLPIYHLAVTGLGALALVTWKWYQHHFQFGGYTVLATFLVVFIAGTNELSLVHLTLLLAVSGLAYYLQYGWPPVWYWWVVLVGLISSGIALGAPGNMARMELYPVDKSWLATIPLTAATSVFLVADWLMDSLLIPVALLLLAVRHWFLPAQNYSLLARPWLWAISLLVLCPLSLFPLLYATGGTSLPERVTDILYLLFSSIFLFTSLSFDQQYAEHKKNKVPTTTQKVFLGALAFFICGQLLLRGLDIDRSPERRHLSPVALIRVDANIGQAYQQLLAGVPQQYDQQMRQIEEKVRTCLNDTCKVPPLTTAHFIGYDPLYDRLHQEGERGMVRFFGGPPSRQILYSTE